MTSPYLLDAQWIEDGNIEFITTSILTVILSLVFTVLLIDSFYLIIANNQNAYFVGNLIAIFRVLYLQLAVLLNLNYLTMWKNLIKHSTVFRLALVRSVGYGLVIQMVNR